VKKEYKGSPAQQFRCVGYIQRSVTLAHLLVCFNKRNNTLSTLLIGNEIKDG